MPGISHDTSFHRNPACGELFRAERLVVRSLRRWLRGGADWDRAVAEASRVLKPVQAVTFVNGLAGMANALDDGARRMLCLRFPSCARVATDERAILALIGALQQDRFDVGHALLRYLIRPGGRQVAMAHAVSVAHALQKSGLGIARPRAPRPSRVHDKVGLRAVA